MNYKEIKYEMLMPDLNRIEKLTSFLGWKELRDLYGYCTEYKKIQNPNACIRTQSEIRLHRKIKRATKLKVYPSVWIGRFCVDYFIPSVKGVSSSGKTTMRGIAIEVNGPVHNYEGKMAKDEARGEVLKALGIGVINIENADMDHPTNRAVVNTIKSLPRLSSRCRKRLWSRVHAWTLIANKSLYFGEPHEFV